MDADKRIQVALNAAVLKLLRPLCRLLLRHHVPFAAFEELAKHTYVQVALDDFGIPGKKPTLSRASILTGLTRKDVQRLVADTAPERAASDELQPRRARADRLGSGRRVPARTASRGTRSAGRLRQLRDAGAPVQRRHAGARGAGRTSARRFGAPA